MNDKRRDTVAGFIMAVGVVFVLIAGGVFATTAWSYQPEPVKRLVLLVMTAGMFGLERFLSSKGRLPKTQLAVFGIGVVFAGYTLIAFLGGTHFPELEQWDDVKLFASSVLMALLVGIRFKTGISSYIGFYFGMLLLLFDSIFIWGFSTCVTLFGAEPSQLVIVLAGVVLAYAIFYLTGGEFLKGSRAVDVIYKVGFLLHGIALWYQLDWDLFFDRQEAPERLAVSVLLCLTAFCMWRAMEKGQQTAGSCGRIWRGIHSLLLMWFIYAASDLALYEIYYDKHGSYAWWDVCFAAYFINVLLMLVLLRKEMKFLLLRIAPILAIGQLLTFASLCGGEIRILFYPFSLVCMAACFLLPWREAGSGSCLSGRRYFTAGILQAVSAFTLLILNIYCIEEEVNFFFVFWILLTIYYAHRALLSETAVWSRVLWTFAVLSGIGIFCSQSFVEISEQFMVEYVCVWIEIAILLFGKIWDSSKNEVVKGLQFAFHCCLLLVLLLWNLSGGEAANALLLGGISLTMILVANYLNRKNYMLAGVIVLFLLVVYATRGLWLNIAWWAYLLAAGVVLIVLASRFLYKD